MVSFSSSTKQGAFQVHDAAVLFCFCITNLVSLNKLFEKLLILVFALLEMAHASLQRCKFMNFDKARQ